MEKLKLGFECGKVCTECGEPVALDAHGRFTCFTCGRFVGKVEDKQVVDLRPQKQISDQLPLFKMGWGLFDDTPKKKGGKK